MKTWTRNSLLAAVAATSGIASAQDAQNADALAKQLSNPVAALISVPLQFNWDTELGPQDEGERSTLNVQPVVPISIGPDWNLISRTILPVIDQSDVIAGTGSQSGLGDVVQSVFFSPKAPTASGWILGAGPVFLLPTATDDLLGSEKWGAGPTAVALKQTATGLTYGGLVNHIESFAGTDERADVSATFLQPFVSQALGQGRTVTLNLESTYDWEAGQWNVPMNLSYSKVTKFGSQLVSLGVGARYYLEKPDNGADWGIRVVFTLLYPR